MGRVPHLGTCRTTLTAEWESWGLVPSHLPVGFRKQCFLSVVDIYWRHVPGRMLGLRGQRRIKHSPCPLGAE